MVVGVPLRTTAPGWKAFTVTVEGGNTPSPPDSPNSAWSGAGKALRILHVLSSSCFWPLCIGHTAPGASGQSQASSAWVTETRHNIMGAAATPANWQASQLQTSQPR